jgi:hypothetical protein
MLHDYVLSMKSQESLQHMLIGPAGLVVLMNAVLMLGLST